MNLSHNDLVGTGGIESLGSLLDYTSCLVTLNLSENKLGDEGIELLSKAFDEGKSKLVRLYLGYVGATAVGFKTLFMSLKINQHLRHLTIDGNDFKSPPRYTREQLRMKQKYHNYELPQYTNPNFDQISIFLWNNKRLETLEMRNCMLDD